MPAHPQNLARPAGLPCTSQPARQPKNFAANPAVNTKRKERIMPSVTEGTIIEAGNLTRPIILDTDKNGQPWARAQVVVNSHIRNQNNDWEETATSYQLAVFGDDALQLAATQKQSGNVKVLFSGELTNRAWEADGKHGISHDVRVKQIGVSLDKQHVTAVRPDGKPIGSGRENQAAQETGQESVRAADIAGQQQGLGPAGMGQPGPTSSIPAEAGAQAAQTVAAQTNLMAMNM